MTHHTWLSSAENIVNKKHSALAADQVIRLVFLMNNMLCVASRSRLFLNGSYFEFMLLFITLSVEVFSGY